MKDLKRDKSVPFYTNETKLAESIGWPLYDD